MSTKSIADAPADADLPEVVERIDSFDQLIDKNWDLIDEAVRKALSGRMTDPEAERARARWHREANNHLDLMRKLINDRELLIQGFEVEELKAGREGQP